MIVVVLFTLCGPLGLGGTATGNTLTSGSSCSLGGACTATGLFTGTDLFELGVIHAGHDQCDVAGALVDAAGTPTGTGTEALQGGTLIGVTGHDGQFVSRLAIVVLGVGHS